MKSVGAYLVDWPGGSNAFAERRQAWYDGGAMKILRKIAKAQITELECDRLRVQIDLLRWPKNSYGFAWRVLALAVLETKMTMWRAVCH